ncbi:VOC family protein [Actinoplanes sp. GCM10030250]|uniref:VOC family protein n=1 Tax=Actinoplanes sp. GCM10030250 TaxID=3273376 RepID=UPI00360F014F
MALRPVQVNIKALDAPAIGRFWAAALGWTAHQPGVTTYVGPTADLVWPDPVVVGIDVVPVPEAKTPVPGAKTPVPGAKTPVPGAKTAAKNRVHLDLATTSAAHQAELIERLRDLGATRADVGQGDVPWTVLADPEGNEFCVLEPREIYQDTGPIAAIVVDCADPRAMAQFWGRAIDWTPHEATDGAAVFRSAKGSGPYLEFLRTPGAKSAPDRVHLDLLPYPGDDKEAEVTRLRALGAADLDLGQGDVPWTCLSDPDGHEFCVLGPS